MLSRFSKSYSKYFNKNRQTLFFSSDSKRNGLLVLEDGSVYSGKMFGAKRSTTGEVVFSTNMVGYPESMTDPSFYGQIINLTYPMIGNYGIPDLKYDEFNLNKYFESRRIWCNGLVIQDYSNTYSHWNANKSLSDWMKEYNIPGIYDIDTRDLTKKIRENGSMAGKIVYNNEDIPINNYNDTNLVKMVSHEKIRTFGDGDIHIVALDCGMKENIIRCLLEKNAKVTVVPYDYDFRKMDYDGLFISNGPGNPDMCSKTIYNIREAMTGEKPIFGICLGNQLLAKAAGIQTYKMKFGNRGQNQPVIDLLTNKVFISSQNHGYSFDPCG